MTLFVPGIGTVVRIEKNIYINKICTFSYKIVVCIAQPKGLKKDRNRPYIDIEEQRNSTTKKYTNPRRTLNTHTHSTARY